MPDQPEAFSRVLIDRALAESDWDLLDPKSVRFESAGRDGRADYVLLGKNGPLCVLEAKREDLDPYDAKEQARGYAENLNAPFIILSNGREHWFWNYARADQRDAYRIERLPSPDDLDRLRLKNLQPPRPLMTEIVTPELPHAFQARPNSSRLSDRSNRRNRATIRPRAPPQIPARNGHGHRQNAALCRAHPPLPCHSQCRARPVHRGPHRACEADHGRLQRRPAGIQARHLQNRPPATGELLGSWSSSPRSNR